jgi:hypothetical protein
VVARRLKEVLESAKRSAHQRPRRTEQELAARFELDNPIDQWDPAADGLIGQVNGLPMR